MLALATIAPSVSVATFGRRRRAPLRPTTVAWVGAATERVTSTADVPFELTPALKTQWERDGYLVLPKFAGPSDVAALLDRAATLVAGAEADAVAKAAEGQESSVPRFSTTRQEAVTAADGAARFAASAGGVEFFFEDDDGAPSNAAAPPRVNKIGHALHDVDETFRRFSRSQRMTSLVRSLGFDCPAPVQSMYICKSGDRGGEVAPHQARGSIRVRPWAAAAAAAIATVTAAYTCRCRSR